MQRAGADRGLELVAGALGDDLAVVDNRDAVGELVGLVQVLGGQQHGGARGHQRAHDLPNLVAAARVQTGGGFVEEDQLGGDHDAGRDVDPPPHATGIGLHLPSASFGQTERVEQLGRPRLGRRPRVAPQPGEQHEVVHARQVFVDRCELAGHAHSAAHRVGLGDDVVTEHPCAAVGRPQQRRQHADGGGLAGAVGSKYAVDEARRNPQVQTVHRPRVPKCLTRPLASIARPVPACMLLLLAEKGWLSRE